MSGTDAGHWSRLDLAPGRRSLIEASAGTGKTWTISLLYLRLLLEQGLSPARIVVTTFTDAAAQELRQRLRARLLWAEDLATAGAPLPATSAEPGDEEWLRARWSSPGSASRDRLRLRLALAELDQAPIGTLHAICRRVLADFPFESGSDFAAAELVDTDSLLDELARDVWRHLQQGDGGPLPAPASLDLARLRSGLKAYLAPGVCLEGPAVAAPDVEQARALGARLRALADDAGLFARKNAIVIGAMQRVADWCEWIEGLPSGKDCDALAKAFGGNQLSPAGEASADLRGAIDEAMALIAQAEAAAEAQALAFWRHWVGEASRWRAQRLAARGQLGFDELLTRVQAALQRDGSDLSERLFEAWPAALVDEFQDTDGLQYGLLDRLYRDGAGRPRGCLVMIGDPKQAIYRFRGGDIHAYLAASAQADQRLDLAQNQRSSTPLVAALNELFALAGPALSADPFHPIRYHPVRAAGRRDATPYRIDAEPCRRPLSIHWLASPPAAAVDRRRLALRACAAHIADLLGSGRHRIGERALAPGDIAVLLPRNADVARLRALLLARGVPCVGQARSSVFDSDWARALQIVLHALAQPGDEAAVGAALASRLGGFDFDALAALRERSADWEQALARFAEGHRRWREQGVLAALQPLLLQAAPRLLAEPEGERALTDLRHLAELLAAREREQPGERELLAWLARQREGAGGGEDAADQRQLRIESDAAKLRLMTLHGSKGLEFPVVFLPLLWDQAARAREDFGLVSEPARGQRRPARGSAERDQLRQEDQEERFRLLYVALTRAIHACHVYALPPERGASGRSSKPLADPQRSALDALLARLPAADARDAACPHIDWREGWDFAGSYRPAGAAAIAAPRVLPLPPRRPLAQRHSFTSLVRLQAAGQEAPAGDEDDAAAREADIAAMEEESVHPELLALAPWRGSGFGNALHLAFERRRRDRPFAQQLELLRAVLQAEGVAPGGAALEAMLPRLAARLDACLQAPILPGCRLAALDPARERAEMGFTFVLDAVRLDRLRAVCAMHDEPALVPALPATRLRGLMSGKIDLVFEHAGRFHVLDYKSNWLDEGARLSRYRGAALGQAMDAHHYRFQALLYTLALHRYLRQRLPGYAPHRHLGESVYLFLRAVGLDEDAGLWRQRFEPALVEALDAVFAEGEPA